MCAYSSEIRVMIEMLSPLHHSIVRGSSAISHRENPVAREIALRVLIRYVVLTPKNDKQRNRPASCVHALEHCSQTVLTPVVSSEYFTLCLDLGS